MYHYTFIQCTTPRADPKVNYGPWVTYQCRFINCNKGTTQGEILIMGRGYACAGVECKGNLCTFETSAVNRKLCPPPKKNKSTKKTSIKKSKMVKWCNLRAK